MDKLSSAMLHILLMSGLTFVLLSLKYPWSFFYQFLNSLVLYWRPAGTCWHGRHFVAIYNNKIRACTNITSFLSCILGAILHKCNILFTLLVLEIR
jgi:hypothetical protein